MEASDTKEREERAPHESRTVGQINDIEDAKNQRIPHGKKGKGRSLPDTINQLLRELRHTAPSPGTERRAFPLAFRLSGYLLLKQLEFSVFDYLNDGRMHRLALGIDRKLPENRVQILDIGQGIPDCL